MKMNGDSSGGCGPEEGASPGAERHSSLERILATLNDENRRYLLYHLLDEDVSDLDTAARRVAAWKYDCRPDDVPEDVHERTKYKLYHAHVPRLVDLDIVEFDERSEALRFWKTPEKLAEFLRLCRDVDGIE